MKTFILRVVGYVLLMLQFSCSKSSVDPPIPEPEPGGNLNNKVEVMISYLGGPFISHSAIGNKTGFNRTIFPYSQYTTQDTIIMISAHMPKGGLYIYLPNDITVGTYVFKLWGIPGNWALPPWCEIISGNYITSLNFYRTMGGNDSGSITIEVLTPNYIKGTFTTVLHDTFFNSEVIQISTGSFKGDISTG